MTPAFEKGGGAKAHKTKVILGYLMKSGVA